MSDQVETKDDVEINEWVYESQCPVCGSSEDTAVAGAVRPVIWLCSGCDSSWTRSTFEEIGEPSRY